jgi:hypothetical protein
MDPLHARLPAHLVMHARRLTSPLALRRPLLLLLLHQARYDFLVSIDRFRGLVSNYSTITNGTQGNTCE